LIDPSALSAPYDKDYTEIYSNSFAFVALKADGSITAWGKAGWGGTGAPDDSGYIKIYSTHKGVPETPHALIDPSALIAAKPL
jgi:hypothetical protein